MPALTTYARATGDRATDIAIIARRVRECWPGATEDDALDVARWEVAALHAEMRTAPDLATARHLYHRARERSLDRPRDRAARDASDAALCVLKAAEARERIRKMECAA